MNYPELSEIQLKVKNSLDILIRNDFFLLISDVNERSISHRLAVYLEHQFKDWDVDCEYNRDHKKIKRLKLKPKELKSDDTEATTVYPDIIIHKRDKEDNLLVIEIKKSTNHQSEDFDLEKLRAYREELEYRHTLFLKIFTNGGKNPYEEKWD